MSYKRIGGAIRELREEQGITQEELAKAIKVSSRTVMRLENGQAVTIKLETLKKIATFFCLHESFFIDVSESDSVSITDANRKKLTPIPENSDANPSNLKAYSDTVCIPVFYSLEASAGTGALNIESEEVERKEISKNALKELFNVAGDFKSLFIMRSRGDSMFPIIPRQCFLLVQKTPQVRESEVCVARIGEEMYVKKIVKLPRVRLLSENERYEPINITEDMDFEIIGRVVGYFGRL